MLVVQGSRKVENPKIYIRIHKISGYIFALLFLVMFIGMIMRVKNYWEESSPRVALHVALAVALFFILAMKILIPRFFKRLSVYLFGLGVIVYAMSFCLVIITAGYYIIWKTEERAVIHPAETHLADDYLGKTLFIDKCSVCHDLKSIMKPRSPDDWAMVVKRMVNMAAPRITADEGSIIVSYLAGTHAPQPVTLKRDASIVEKHCYPCHKPTEIFRVKYTRAEWVEIVKQMNEHDPSLVPLDELNNIVDFLISGQENAAASDQPTKQ